jgi:hypothetical protein
MHAHYVGWTKAQKERIARVLALGCCICGLETHGSPLEVHHLISGGKRMGHDFTVCLCRYHHRGIGYHRRLMIDRGPSLAHGSKLFTEAYGSQQNLWMRTQTRLGLPCNWPTSKIVPRQSLIEGNT